MKNSDRHECYWLIGMMLLRKKQDAIKVAFWS
jgi:hypothetical protein